MFDRQQLMRQISEICFVIDDLTLYLDTHPLDGDALDEIGRAMAKRKELLCTYAKEFEPLTVNCIHVGPPDGQKSLLGARSDSQSGQAAPSGGQASLAAQQNNLSGQHTKYAGKRHWTWTDGPLPWEGGML